MFSSSAVEFKTFGLTSECVKKDGHIITENIIKLAEIIEQLNITRTRGALTLLSSEWKRLLVPHRDQKKLEAALFLMF